MTYTDDNPLTLFLKKLDLTIYKDQCFIACNYQLSPTDLYKTACINIRLKRLRTEHYLISGGGGGGGGGWYCFEKIICFLTGVTEIKCCQ